MKSNSLILWSILLGLITASLCTLYVAQPSTIHDTQAHPDAFFEHFTHREYNTDGTLHLRLLAHRLMHFKKYNSSQIYLPNISLYNTQASTWHIRALHAHSWYGRNTIRLQDKVVFFNPGSDAKATQAGQQTTTKTPRTTIKTSSAYLYPQDHYATSAQHVIMLRPGSTLQGKGMHADLNSGIINILSHTHGTYQAPHPSPGP